VGLGVLATMILVLVVSLVMLRSRHPDAVASRAWFRAPVVESPA